MPNDTRVLAKCAPLWKHSRVRCSKPATRHPADETRGPRTLVLRGMEHLTVKNGDVLLLVGTNKGAFLLRSTRDRTRWDVAGPYFHGQGVNSMAYDGRNGRHRLWISTNSLRGARTRTAFTMWEPPRTM